MAAVATMIGTFVGVGLLVTIVLTGIICSTLRAWQRRQIASGAHNQEYYSLELGSLPPRRVLSPPPRQDLLGFPRPNYYQQHLQRIGSFPLPPPPAATGMTRGREVTTNRNHRGRRDSRSTTPTPTSRCRRHDPNRNHHHHHPPDHPTYYVPRQLSNLVEEPEPLTPRLPLPLPPPPIHSSTSPQQQQHQERKEDGSSNRNNNNLDQRDQDQVSNTPSRRENTTITTTSIVEQEDMDRDDDEDNNNGYHDSSSLVGGPITVEQARPARVVRAQEIHVVRGRSTRSHRQTDTSQRSEK